MLLWRAGRADYGGFVREDLVTWKMKWVTGGLSSLLGGFSGVFGGCFCENDFEVVVYLGRLLGQDAALLQVFV